MSSLTKDQRLHCCCLARTSLWIALPAWYAYKEDLYCHALIILLASCFSILHWTHYTLYSKWFWLDIFWANATILYILYNTPPHRLAFQLSWIISAGVFFIHACINPLGTSRGLASHVWFRYLTYCGAMGSFMEWSCYMLLWHSLCYLLTIGLSYHYGNEGGRIVWSMISLIILFTWCMSEYFGTIME